MQYTPFSLIRDINGVNGFGLPFTINKYSAALVQNTEETLTIPSYAAQYLAIFSFDVGAAVWVANNETAALPAGASFAATTSELNPTARQVSAADVLHFYTGDSTSQVGVTLYALS